jgi:hypothetical protein
LPEKGHINPYNGCRILLISAVYAATPGFEPPISPGEPVVYAAVVAAAVYLKSFLAVITVSLGSY